MRQLGVAFWTYFTHYLRADGDSGPGVDSRPALPGSCRATLGSTVDTCIASVSRVLWKNFHVYVLVNSCPEVDFVLLSVVASPVEIPQVQFLDQLFMPVEVPTPVGAVLGQGLHGCCVWCRWPNSAEHSGDSTVAVLGPVVYARCCADTCENPQVLFSDKDSDVPVFNDTCLGQSRQLQFLDKVIDVPVISTSRAHGDPDSASRTRRARFMHDRCLWWSRQCVSDKDADVPVVAHDRCPHPA